MRPELPPLTVDVCLPCWRDIYGAVPSRALVRVDRRRFTVRDGDLIVVHRRVMFDDHVVAAACGSLYTHAGVGELGLGS